MGGAQQSVGMAVVAMSMVDKMELHANRLTHLKPSFKVILYFSSLA